MVERRPTMIPAAFVTRCMRTTSSGALMSPLPITGMSSASTTAAISSQRACPVYICVRVRACSVNAFAPASCMRSAIPTGSRVSSLQPERVFTVTGRCVAPTTARMMRCTSSRSLRQPDPPFRFTTFLTGQPKLMSTNSGWKTSVTSAAASAMAAGSAPKICTPIGRSSALKRSFESVASFSRRIPSAERNSVTTTSAPCAAHSRRKGDSETPAIGAR
jgi:hypothetical protein